MKFNIKLLLFVAVFETGLYTADANPVDNPFPFWDEVQNVYCNKDGQTAAHIFILTQPDSKAVAFAALLKENHLLVNGLDKAGQSPLHQAARLGKPNMVTVLLLEKALVNRPDDFGSTPLHNAAESGDEQTFMLILNNGGEKSINIPNRWGVTPLHQSARLGKSTEIVRALLYAGADPDLRAESMYANEQTQTALDIAQEENHAEIVKILEKPRGRNAEALQEEKENFSSPQDSQKRPKKKRLSLEHLN